MKKHEKKFFKQFIGRKVEKFSEKPFKSTFKINTIKGISINPNINEIGFTFEEDESIVNCVMCKIL